MKPLLVLVVAMAAVALGVDVLADLTQDRPDAVLPGSHTEIVLDVEARDRTGSALLAAQGLWGACRGNVRHRLSEPGVVQVDGGRFRLVTEPALGEHAWRRLQGCLEDATIDRVKAHVVSKRDVAPAPTP